MRISKVATLIHLPVPHKRALEQESKARGITASVLLEQLLERELESTFPEIKEYIDLRNRLTDLTLINNNR